MYASLCIPRSYAHTNIMIITLEISHGKLRSPVFQLKPISLVIYQIMYIVFPNSNKLNTDVTENYSRLDPELVLAHKTNKQASYSHTPNLTHYYLFLYLINKTEC